MRWTTDGVVYAKESSTLMLSWVLGYLRFEKLREDARNKKRESEAEELAAEEPDGLTFLGVAVPRAALSTPRHQGMQQWLNEQ